MDTKPLTREELIAGLKRIASECTSEEEVRLRVSKEYPGTAVAVVYHKRSYMGMAMSHSHRGPISF